MLWQVVKHIYVWVGVSGYDGDACLLQLMFKIICKKKKKIKSKSEVVLNKTSRDSKKLPEKADGTMDRRSNNYTSRAAQGS